MAFTCGMLLENGNQCLHVSRREALGCITRGRVVDFANQCNKERYEAMEFVKKANVIASEQADKITKLEAAATEWEAKKLEATEALKSQNDFVDKLQRDIKIITEERDALAQAAIYEAQKKAAPVA